MNTSTPAGKLFATLLLLFAAFFCATDAQAEPPTEGQAEPVAVFLVDDQTGPELALKHGIQPLVAADIEVLVNAVLRGTVTMRIFHQAVDEDSTDNAVCKVDFHPETVRPAPTPVPKGLPLTKLMKARKDHAEKQAAWNAERDQYRAGLIAEIERFVKGVDTTQAEVSTRFARILALRKGRDFNRSDILACITTANRMLGSTGQRFLVLNTDCEDLSAKRKPRITPLVTTELDPQVELIFVNTSGLPDQSPMFRGLANKVHHADSMQAAMEIIATALNPAIPEAAK